MDLSKDTIDKRIDNLRTGYESYSGSLRSRNRTYLRLFSPEYNSDLKEHDQWSDEIKASNVGHARSSYNITRAVVELWTALEAYPLPNIKWTEEFVPPPVPDIDPEVHSQREQTSRARRLVSQQIATRREQALDKRHRLGRLDRHYYNWVLRKNLYGHSWLCAMPDPDRKRFTYRSTYDPSTVYPVWSAADQNDLSAILVVTRQRARSLAEQYPEVIDLDDDGSASVSGFYNGTATTSTSAERQFVWVEEYWILDRTFKKGGKNPVESRVVGATRVNGEIVEYDEYPGWKALPYFYNENDNLRDRLGFSDAATVGPIQDSINRFMSQQQDVIAGSSRPKYKFRSENDRQIELNDEGLIHLDPDEDIDQLDQNLNTFPTQVHGTQLMEMLARATGLNDSVFGRVVASQNSGRALAQAWRSVASRLVPRLQSDADALDRLTSYELDLMELYDWEGSKALFDGNRDFAPEFPNQEPRDFMEVTSDAVTRLNAGLTDYRGAMEDIGEKSPDEMMERVRGDYTDSVMHPEKSQAYLLLQREQQQMEIEAAQAQQQIQAQQSALQQAANQPPSGAPGGSNGGPNLAGNRAAAAQAQTQAAQQAAPGAVPGSPQPSTQPGQAANASQPLQVSTLVQDGGSAKNRVIASY